MTHNKYTTVYSLYQVFCISSTNCIIRTAVSELYDLNEVVGPAHVEGGAILGHHVQAKAPRKDLLLWITMVTPTKAFSDSRKKGKGRFYIL
jgi:hypothetical protein